MPLIPKKNETPEPSPATAPRTPIEGFGGVAERDVQLIERLSLDLNNLARAIRKGDKDAAIAIYPRLAKLATDGERVRVIARRAFSNA